MPGAHRKMRAAVLLAAVLVLLPLVLTPLFVAVRFLDMLDSPLGLQKPISLFWDGETPALVFLSQHIRPFAPGSSQTDGFLLWGLEDSNVVQIREFTPPAGLESAHIGGAFSLAGEVYVAHSDELVALTSTHRVSIPDSGFVLAICQDAGFVWLLLKDAEGLKITRFDGERLTTPVLVAPPLQSSWKAGKRHHAALLPVDGGWLVIAGTDSGARYKVLPQGRESFWASIPWQPAPFERAAWTAYTHRGKPRILALGLRQMLNPMRLAYLLWTDPNLNAELYGFDGNSWQPLRHIKHPMIGETLAASSRLPQPALVVAAALGFDAGWNLYRFEIGKRGEEPWMPVSMYLEGPFDLDFPRLVGLALWAKALWIFAFLAAIVLLDRLMRHWRPGSFVTRKGYWLSYAPLWRRGMARFVDLLCVFLPTFGLMVLILPFWLDTGQMGDREIQRRVFGALLVLPVGLNLVPLVFWSLLEWRTGQTPGKWLLRIRVVDARTLRPPTLGKAFLRNLLLAVEALSYGLAALFTIPMSRNQRRIGDMAAGTYVVMEDGPSGRIREKNHLADGER